MVGDQRESGEFEQYAPLKLKPVKQSEECFGRE